MFIQENKSKTFYDILKIAPDSSDEEVKKAYLELARIYHPDKNPGNRKIAALRFRMINEAYTTLKTPESRNHYNRLLRTKRNKLKTAPLKADNDNNKLISNDTGLWNSLIGFFTPQKSLEPKNQSPRKDR